MNIRPYLKQPSQAISHSTHTTEKSMGATMGIRFENSVGVYTPGFSEGEDEGEDGFFRNLLDTRSEGTAFVTIRKVFHSRRNYGKHK